MAAATPVLPDEPSRDWALRPMRLSDARQVARVHRTVLADGFLPSLGEGVLAHVYAASATAPLTVALVVESGEEVVGFVLATRDTRRLFRHVLVRRGIGLGIAVFRALLRKPGLVHKVFETFRYPARSATPSGRRPDEAELVAIGVLSRHRGLGWARAMVQELSREFWRLGVRAYGVATYASNAEACGLYESLGF